MESIGNVMQVTSDVAQQVNEADKKPLEKQTTEKSSDVFLETLNSQNDRGVLLINRASPLFVLLIARLNGFEGSGTNNGAASNAINDSLNSEEVGMPSNVTTAVSAATTNTDTDAENNANITVTTNNTNNTNSTNSNTGSENTDNNSSANGVTGVRNIPILDHVAVPTLGFGGNTTAATGTEPATNNTTGNNTTASVRNVPILGHVTVPSLGTVGGGTSQGTGANSSAVGSPLVSTSPVATQVGNGFQALLAGNTSADNNSSNSSHWRRGSSSSSSSGFNINSFFGR